MANLSDITALKETVDRLRREVDKASGALERETEEMKKQFGCHSLEEAEELQKKLRIEEAKAKTAFDEAMIKFQEEWEDKI